jgi:hypothetical protein
VGGAGAGEKKLPWGCLEERSGRRRPAAVAGVGYGGQIFLFLSFPLSSLPSVPTDIVSILVVGICLHVRAAME